MVKHFSACPTPGLFAMTRSVFWAIQETSTTFPLMLITLQLLVLFCSPSFSSLITVPHSHDIWLHDICRSQSALVLLPSLTNMFEHL